MHKHTNWLNIASSWNSMVSSTFTLVMSFFSDISELKHMIIQNVYSLSDSSNFLAWMLSPYHLFQVIVTQVELFSVVLLHINVSRSISSFLIFLHLFDNENLTSYVQAWCDHLIKIRQFIIHLISQFQSLYILLHNSSGDESIIIYKDQLFL